MKYVVTNIQQVKQTQTIDASNEKHALELFGDSHGYPDWYAINTMVENEYMLVNSYGTTVRFQVVKL